MKKLLALLLALTMALSVTAALAEVTYPIDTKGEDVTLTVFCVNKVSNYAANYNDVPFFQKLEEQTGIHIEFIHPAASGLQETMNLLFLGDDLPDIILCGNLYNGGEFQGVADGYFLDLAPYLPEYAPDYWAYVSADDETYRQVANAEGVIPCFHIVKPVADPPYQYFMLRQDMLDELDAEIPTTIAEFEQLFDKMLAKGIVPYMPASNGYEKQIMGAFDVIRDFYLNADGQIVYGQVQPQFKEYLELMHSWYEKGYISKDFTAATSSNTNTLFDTGVIGTYVAAVVATYNRGQSAGFEVVSAPYMRLEPEQQLHWEDYNITTITPHNEANAVITTTCKYPEIAVQWMNYCYTEAGANLANWGTEGETYTVDENGKKVYTDLLLNNETMSTSQASYFYKMHVWPKMQEPDVVCHADLLKSEGALNSRLAWANDSYVDSSYVLPTLALSADALNAKTEIMSEITTFVDEMTLKFITGEASLDDFDAFTAQVWDSGLQDVLDIMTAAYEEYMSITVPEK